MIYLYCNPGCKCFIPFLQNLEFLLNKNGIPAKIDLQYNPATDTGEDLWFVIWNWIQVLPKKCIIYNFDPMVPHIDKGIHDLVTRSPHSKVLKFADYCYGLNQAKIADLNFDNTFLIYGHSVYHNYILDRLVPFHNNITKDIDILWYGNISERRVPILKAVDELARRKGYKFMLRNNNLFDEREVGNYLSG